MSGPRFDEMSDEEFLNQSMAQEVPVVSEPEVVTPDEPAAQASETAEAETDVAATAGDEDDGADTSVADEDLDASQAGTEPTDTTETAAEPNPADASGDGDTTPKQTEAIDDKAAAPNYEALYKQVMSTFKANGKDITPASPEEATRLMQMGANYAKKMEGLKPHLKILRMLENNQLLDEGKLSFLIDLDKKDPKAIQKLLHDGKVDPMDLDPSAEPTYQPTNRAVSDKEMALHDAIEAVQSTPTGKDTITLVNKEFDRDSKLVITENPHLLSVIDDHRSTGVYAKITDEIERRKLFGEFRNVPFIHAYKAVGDELHAQGKLLPAEGPAGQPTPAPQAVQNQPLDTRPARSSKPAASREQVRAVTSAPGSNAKTPKPSFNPLTMSDAEVMAIPTNF